jgi:diadenosine tetraphosphate (Ap4A) HIT family hydrolase
MPCVIRRYNPKRSLKKEHPMADCIFCKNLPKILENNLAYAFYDIKPLSPGHMLFIPKKHYEQIFEASPEDIKALFDLINRAKILLDQEHHPDGYNVAANCGAAAGQIIMHAHLHLIPRYKNKEFPPKAN